jgi:hypothetical protein
MESTTFKSILDEALDERLDKLFGGMDDTLRQVTKFSLIHDDPLNQDEVKAAIQRIREVGAKMDYFIKELEGTLDSCGNIVSIDCINNV